MVTNKKYSKFRIVLLVSVILFSSQLLMASSYSFRVQCAKQGDSDLVVILKKIPNKETFFTQTALALYFSGDYTEDFFDAMDVLDDCHSKGIPNAFIRVFKNDAYVSDESSRVLLELIMSGKLMPSIMLQYQKKQEKRRIEEELLAEKRRAEKAKILAEQKRLEEERLYPERARKRKEKEASEKLAEVKRIKDEKLAVIAAKKKEQEQETAKIAEAARLAEIERVEALRIAEVAAKKKAEAARLVEEARVLAEKKRIEDERLVAEAAKKKAEEEEVARLAEVARVLAEEKRIEALRIAEVAAKKKAADEEVARIVEEARIIAEAKRVEDERIAAEAAKKKAKEDELARVAKKAEDERKATEAKKIAQEKVIAEKAKLKKEKEVQEQNKIAAEIKKKEAEIAAVLAKRENKIAEKKAEEEKIVSKQVAKILEEQKTAEKAVEKLQRKLAERKRVSEQNAKAKSNTKEQLQSLEKDKNGSAGITNKEFKKEQKHGKREFKKRTKEQNLKLEEEGKQRELSEALALELEKVRITKLKQAILSGGIDTSAIEDEQENPVKEEGNEQKSNLTAKKELDESLVEDQYMLAIVRKEKKAAQDLIDNPEKVANEKIKFKVSQSPSFKIVVGKFLTKEDPIPDYSGFELVVYHMEIGYDTYYFMGDWPSLTDALIVLLDLKQDPANETFEVKGMYHGNPISLEMASDLGIQYRRQLAE